MFYVLHKEIERVGSPAHDVNEARGVKGAPRDWCCPL